MATESTSIQSARKQLAAANAAFEAAKPTFATIAGASVLPKTGTPTASDLSAARYTAMAAASGISNVFGANSKISVEAQSTPYILAINSAQAALDKAMQNVEDNSDAFALLKDIFTAYGLESLIPEIEGYMKQGIGPNQATLLLKQTTAYKTRFAGNEKRRNAGLNVISEAEYLALENDYTSTLKAYGLQNQFGIDRKTKQSKMADIIGADISAVEFKDRIDTAVSRVQQADQNTKDQLKNFYGIGDTDLVGYFLNPTQALPELKNKVTTAEIGGAAIAQGLTTTEATARDLTKYGVDLATARQGYATIADILPTTEKLADIYKEENIQYNQAAAEAETFKGLASEKRKRQKLAAKEVAAFSGQSGVARGSLSTNYLSRSSSEGQF